MPEINMDKGKKDYIVIFIIMISAIYLINPTFGIFEFIPDNLPIIGNLDEGMATFLLFSGLNYFGYNFTSFINRNK